MGTSESTTVNPARLRREYGPAPWWDRDSLAELLLDHGLTSREIATIWPVHRSTIDEWAAEYGIDRRGA